MSDFERRVGEALSAAADSAPDAGLDAAGLAAGARARARAARRRTTRLVAAAAVLALGVPAAVVAARDSGAPPAGSTSDGTAATDPATEDPGGVPDLPPGYRTESWRNLEIHVPSSWGHGRLSAWCAAGEEPGNPVVERPEGPEAAVDCDDPGQGYGLRFLDPPTAGFVQPSGEVEQVVWEAGASHEYPDGAWVGYRIVADTAAALVVAPTPDVARHVLSSARRVEVADGNGCVTAVHANTDFALDGDAPGPLTVCRYQRTWESSSGVSYWLAESRRLSAEDSRAVRGAVGEAPVGGNRFRRCEEGDAEFYLVTTPDQVAFWVYNATCGDHGVLTVDEGGDVVQRGVTEELAAALGSPYGLLGAG